MLENPPVQDSFKFLEMQLNKSNELLSKAKLVCVRLDKVFVMLPYTFSKIELRMRNLMANNRDTLDAISHFMQFYLTNKHFQDLLMRKFAEHIKNKDSEDLKKAHLIAKEYTTNHSSNVKGLSASNLHTESKPDSAFFSSKI